MKEQDKHSYHGDQAEVQWDGRLCIHYGECGRASGELFVGGRQPWCQPDRSTGEEIRDVLLRCPTGALSATFADGSVVEPDSEENHVTVTQNGPLYLRGALNVDGAPDDMPGTRFRAALCRCGASGNKPFCDNSHIEAGFTDSGAVGETGPGHSSETGELTIRPLQDGPVLISGKLTISTSSGRQAWKGEKAAFCRCGESKNKPFCDGSHKEAGFIAP
jgi:CDGSH-type Zn-finger protein/uncharacterized Fe-S cluster protein YjdI